MALRWDLRPIFKNAPADSERATITIRSVISGSLALAATIAVASWGLPLWQYAIIAAAIIFAFDAGDMRVPFEDEGEGIKPVWLYDENGEIREHWTNAADER